MQLPEHTPVSPAIFEQIGERHHLGKRAVIRLPETGVFNAVYQLGDDLILRIPRNHPAHAGAVQKEAAAVPAARAAGVRTPAIVAFDDSRELLPVPYIIYERIQGETLESFGREPGETPEIWRELGRDLGRLHVHVSRVGPVAAIKDRRFPDPREQAEAVAQAGYVTGLEARWLLRWLERIAPACTTPPPKRFLHGDLQGTNIMVQPGSLRYLALIDWGSSGWGDPAADFTGIPLAAAPFLLAGHREVAPLDGDETAEARILWYQLGLALRWVQRQPEPERSWAERPLAMLFGILRFLLDAPAEPWRSLRP